MEADQMMSKAIVVHRMILDKAAQNLRDKQKAEQYNNEAKTKLIKELTSFSPAEHVSYTVGKMFKEQMKGRGRGKGTDASGFKNIDELERKAGVK
eukprot:1492921-Pyramimonas_sp.AAC.1